MSEALQSASPDELVDQIETIRNRLSDTIDELVDRANPKNIASRQISKVRSRFVDEAGHPRFENIVPPVVVTVAVIAGVVVLRRLLK